VKNRSLGGMPPRFRSLAIRGFDNSASEAAINATTTQQSQSVNSRITSGETPQCCASQLCHQKKQRAEDISLIQALPAMIRGRAFVLGTRIGALQLRNRISIGVISGCLRPPVNQLQRFLRLQRFLFVLPDFSNLLHGEAAFSQVDS
jgi:hypothetical protein